MNSFTIYLPEKNFYINKIFSVYFFLYFWQFPNYEVSWEKFSSENNWESC